MQLTSNDVRFYFCSDTFEVPIAQRSRFVGPGGYNIKQIQAETGR